MKYRYYILSMLLFAVASCIDSVVDETVQQEPDRKHRDITVSISQNETKTSVTEDLKVVWSRGDEIAVFDRFQKNSRYRISEGVGSAMAKFTFVEEDDVECEELKKIIAWYPYQQSLDYWVDEFPPYGDVVTIELPKYQSYAENGFGVGANPMVAVAEDIESDALFFQNILGAVRLKIKGDKKVSVIIMDTDRRLSGEANVVINKTDDKYYDIGVYPSIYWYPEEYNVVLTCDEPVQLDENEAAEFWFMVPPATYKWMSFSIYCDDGSVMRKRTDKEVVINRSGVKTFKEFRYEEDADESADKATLIKLYEALGGDDWVISTNWCSDYPLDTWYGVDIDENGRVSEIELIYDGPNSFGLHGEIPKCITDLEGLKKFHFRTWASVTVPDFFWEFAEEKQLDLGIDMNCTGSIPADVVESEWFRSHWNIILPNNKFNINGGKIYAPMNTVEDIDGNAMDLAAEYASKKLTLLIQWVTWGGDNKLYGQVNTLYRKYAHKGFNVIGALESELNEAESFMERNGIVWNSYYPAQKCLGQFMPTCALVNEEGVILWIDSFDVEYGKHLGLEDFLIEYLGPVDEVDYYESSDYSADGKVDVLQKASEGKGIDIVILGDMFNDRQIAAGDFELAAGEAYKYLFDEEPFKTYKNLFNVYSVTAVSKHGQQYYETETALGTQFGEGSYIEGDDYKCFEYAQLAVSEERMDEVLILVMINSNDDGGTCSMWFPDNDDAGDFGNGPAVAYFPVNLSGDLYDLSYVLHHEACGHGFAKLDDEYSYELMGTVTADHISMITSFRDRWGWCRNVDFTNDWEKIQWHHFLTDSRYENEVGIFEGASTYLKGAYRPTENSIMRHNTDGFNAPSREAIYYRIHKLAYGSDWEYDYEDFVEYDDVNRKTSTLNASRRSRASYVERAYLPGHPPVIHQKSWKDAMK